MANINGNNSANTLNGTAFADVIRARGGNDTVFGANGDDWIDAGDGHDRVLGGEGEDTLIGGQGDDTLLGGEGDDVIDGGVGLDWVSFESGAGVNVDLTAGLALGQGSDQLSNVERIIGSSFADILKGSAGANWLRGGDGDDRFTFTLGADTIDGGAGIDTMSFTGAGAGAVQANLLTGAYSGAGFAGSLVAIENLTGGANADTLTGNSAANVIAGGLGADTLNGGAGVDTVSFSGNPNAPFNNGAFVDLSAGTASGGEGADTLLNFENVSGSNYIDTIKGNAGDNLLIGNGGSDSFIATAGIDAIDGGAGTDRIDFSEIGAANANLTTGLYVIDANTRGTMSGVEFLSGGAGADNFVGDGGVNRFDAGGGDDTIAGGGGNDEIWAGAGSDRLIADGGADTLSGNYTFLGFGNSASDVFEVRVNAGAVSISDFEPGTDKLDLTDFGFDQNGASPYWSGSAVQSGPHTILTLSGLNSESITITLQGVTEGHLLALSDMINGSASLIAAPPVYPINGGNGAADVFVLDPQNGDVIIAGFENGLDRMDIAFINQGGWGGFLATNSNDDAVLHFESTSPGQDFTVTLPGMPYYLIDQSDYLF